MRNNFEYLMKRLSPTLRRISHRLNGRFTFFNDDDLCQEALAHLWVLSQDGRLSDKTDSYILQGCYFHLKNYIRTHMDKVNMISMETPIDEDGTMIKDLLASQDTSIFDNIEENALREAVKENKLTAREKEVLDMSLSGLTTREMGSKLNISHVAVVKIRKKIKNKCRTLGKDIKIGYQN